MGKTLVLARAVFAGHNCKFDLQQDILLFDDSWLKNVRFLVHMQKEECKHYRYCVTWCEFNSWFHSYGVKVLRFFIQKFFISLNVRSTVSISVVFIFRSCSVIHLTYLTRFWIHLWRKSSWKHLTHFWPMLPFYTPWKHQKTKCFLVFLGGITCERWPKMG